MATIILDIAGIAGESALTGYENKIEAIAIRDSIAMSRSTSTGSTPTGTSGGKGAHSDICVTRYKDKASPKLAQACAAGECLTADNGTIKIILFKDTDPGTDVSTNPYMEFVLTEPYVSRYEMDTQDAEGRQFEPHMTLEDTQPPTNWGVVGLLPATLRRQGAEYRPVSRSVVGGGILSATDKEIERVWLNSNAVKWTYTPWVSGTKQGVVEKGYNILKGAELV